MGGAAENKALIEKMGAARSLDDLLATMADDVTWTIIGTTKYSGTFNGKQEVVEKLFGPLTAALASFGKTSVNNVIADENYVAVQSTASDRMTKTGKPYNNTYCIVYRISDGKIQEVTEYLDTELVTAAFGE
jgi:ketosteroid isomerase-like protein